MFLGVPHTSTGSCIQGTCSPLLRLSVEELVMISKPQARAGYPIFPYGLNQLPPPHSRGLSRQGTGGAAVLGEQFKSNIRTRDGGSSPSP